MVTDGAIFNPYIAQLPGAGAGVDQWGKTTCYISLKANTYVQVHALLAIFS